MPTARIGPVAGLDAPERRAPRNSLRSRCPPRPGRPPGCWRDPRKLQPRHGGALRLKAAAAPDVRERGPDWQRAGATLQNAIATRARPLILHGGRATSSRTGGGVHPCWFAASSRTGPAVRQGGPYVLRGGAGESGEFCPVSGRDSPPLGAARKVNVLGAESCRSSHSDPRPVAVWGGSHDDGAESWRKDRPI